MTKRGKVILAVIAVIIVVIIGGFFIIINNFPIMNAWNTYCGSHSNNQCPAVACHLVSWCASNKPWISKGSDGAIRMINKPDIDPNIPYQCCTSLIEPKSAL